MMNQRSNVRRFLTALIVVLGWQLVMCAQHPIFKRHDNCIDGMAHKRRTSSVETHAGDTCSPSLSDFQTKNRQNKILIAVVIILLVFMTCFTLFLWRWEILRRRLADKHQLLAETRAAIAGELAERTRLARDLHDGLGSMLTAVKMNLGPLGPHNKGTIDALDEAIRELQRVIHNLLPDVLEREGLDKALENFCKGLPFVQYYSKGYHSRAVESLEVLMYRMAQELVNNAIKHSGASEISLQLLMNETMVSIIICDNGSGMPAEAEWRGTGLRHIRTRLEVFNGRIDIDSRKDEGTEIHITIPIGKTSDER